MDLFYFYIKQYITCLYIIIGFSTIDIIFLFIFYLFLNKQFIFCFDADIRVNPMIQSSLLAV